MKRDGATITETLDGLAQGRFVEEVTERLQKLVKEMNRVAESGVGKPKGKLTITLGLVLDRGIFELEPSYSVKEPATVRARTIMYSDAATGALSKTDRNQLELGPAREVVSDREVRDIRERQAATN